MLSNLWFAAALLFSYTVAVKGQINEVRAVKGDNGKVMCHFTLRSQSEFYEMRFRSLNSSFIDCPVHDSSCIEKLRNNDLIKENCSNDESGLSVSTLCEVTNLFAGNVCCIIRSDTDTQQDCKSFKVSPLLSGFKWWKILLIVFGICVILGIIACICLVFIKKSLKDQDDAKQPVPESAGGPPPPQAFVDGDFEDTPLLSKESDVRHRPSHKS